MASKYSNMTVKAYRRENGRVGVRNHVIILPVDDISNAACEAVANNVKGTLALPHAYGRLQFGEDLDLHFRTMIGTGANPNVAAVVVIGIEPGWTRRIADGIRQALVVPGSGLVKHQAEAAGLDRIFTDAGFEWREPGCSMCLGMNPDKVPPGERCASTSNRNFVGRQGPGARTHLVSPVMAAAAAVTGRLTDVRDLVRAGEGE